VNRIRRLQTNSGLQTVEQALEINYVVNNVLSKAK
jgi:hypothetical protein